jgi:hypothetical protein
MTGRGQEEQHRRKHAPARPMPVLAMDYCFLAVDETVSGTATTLVMHVELSGYTGAAVVPEKGPSPDAAAFLDRHFDEVGYPRVILQSDGSRPSSRWRRCEHEAAKTRTS